MGGATRLNPKRARPSPRWAQLVRAWAGLLLAPSLIGLALALAHAGPFAPHALAPDLAARFARLAAGGAALAAGAMIWAAGAGQPRGAMWDASLRALEQRLGGGRGARLVWLASLVYAAVWSTYTILRHMRLNSTGYDLAIEDQVLWSLSRGRGFAASIEVGNYLGDHFVPAYVLFAPLYRLWDDVRILLVAQSIWLSLGAPAVFRIVRAAGAGLLPAVIAAVAYLLWPAIGYMNKFDVHILTVATPVLLWGIVAWEERRRWTWALILLLSLTIREEVGLAVSLFALAGIWRPGWRRVAGLLALVACAWSAAALFVWIPHFREGLPSDTLARYAYLGDDPASIVMRVLTHPHEPFLRQLGQLRRVLYLFQLLLPTGMFALAAPQFLAPGSFVFLQNFWSDNLNQASIYLHYGAPLIPFVVWSGVRGMVRCLAWADAQAAGFRCLVLGLAAAGPLLAAVLDPPLLEPVLPPYAEVYGLEQGADPGAFAAAKRLIPPDASVVASEAFAPHLSHRSRIQVFHSWVLDRREIRDRSVPRSILHPDEADWIVLDLASLRHREEPREALRFAHARLRAGFRVRFYEKEILLLSRSGEEDPGARARFDGRPGEEERTPGAR